MKILVYDREMAIAGHSIVEILQQNQYKPVFNFELSSDASAVILPYQSQNDISQEAYQKLSHLSQSIPLIGIETTVPIQNGMTISIDLHLPPTVLPHLFIHYLSKTIRHHAIASKYHIRNNEYSQQKAELDRQISLGIDFTRTLSQHELYSLIVKKATELIPAEFYSLIVLEPETTNAHLAGVYDNNPISGHIPIYRCLTDKTYQQLKTSQEPIYDRQPFHTYPFINDEIKRIGRTVMTYMMAPLISQNRLLGVLEIGNRSGHSQFTEIDHRRIALLTNFASVAIHNAELYNRTEHLAQIDDLTQVYNFASTKTFLETFIARETQFCLLFLDLDGFKSVNSRYGHLIGNKALQHVAGIMQNIVGTSGRICRFGGDEFMIIIPSDLDSVMKVSERIITEIEMQQILPGLALSASIGISVFPEDGQTLETIIHCADSAMYHAKDTGRGNIVTFSSISYRHPLDES